MVPNWADLFGNDHVYSSSYFSEQICTFTLGSQGNTYKNTEIWKYFCCIRCFRNRMFVHKHSPLPPPKKIETIKEVWLKEKSIQGRTEVSWQPSEPKTAPKDVSASRASRGVSQRAQPQSQTRLLEKHIPGPAHCCQVHPMIIATDFGEPRGRRWKGIGSTLPTGRRGSAKATQKLPVSPILLCCCPPLMESLATVFQSWKETLSFLATNIAFIANMIMALHYVDLWPSGFQSVLQTSADTWPMYTGTTEMCSASKTTCHKCLAKHRSSSQSILGQDKVNALCYWIWRGKRNIIMWADSQLHSHSFCSTPAPKLLLQCPLVSQFDDLSFPKSLWVMSSATQLDSPSLVTGVSTRLSPVVTPPHMCPSTVPNQIQLLLGREKYIKANKILGEVL